MLIISGKQENRYRKSIHVFNDLMLLYWERHKKHSANSLNVFLAGALGIEPSSGVLETLILPMNYAPICNFAQQRYLYHKPTDMSNNNCKIYTKEKDSAIAFALSVFPLFSHCIKTFKRAPA